MITDLTYLQFLSRFDDAPESWHCRCCRPAGDLFTIDRAISIQSTTPPNPWPLISSSKCSETSGDLGKGSDENLPICLLCTVLDLGVDKVLLLHGLFWLVIVLEELNFMSWNVRVVEKRKQGLAWIYNLWYCGSNGVDWDTSAQRKRNLSEDECDLSGLIIPWRFEINLAFSPPL